MTISREEVLRRFQKDVKNHTAVIEQDDGVFRSIFCSKGSFACHFRVTTWPGHLCISGDMGTFVFERERDMIYDFFPDRSDVCVTKLSRINPQYWGEKVQCGSGGSRRRDPLLGDTTYSMDAVKKAMLEEFQEFALDDVFAQDIDDKGQPVLSEYKSHKMEALRELHDFLKCELSDGVQSEAEAFYEIDRAREYEISGEWTSDGNPQKMLTSYDAYELIETNFEYSFHYLWCCYAILWACKRYAQMKEGRDQKGHDAKVLKGKL